MHRVLKDGLGLPAKNSLDYAKVSLLPGLTGYCLMISDIKIC